MISYRLAVGVFSIVSTVSVYPAFAVGAGMFAVLIMMGVAFAIASCFYSSFIPIVRSIAIVVMIISVLFLLLILELSNTQDFSGLVSIVDASNFIRMAAWPVSAFAIILTASNALVESRGNEDSH